MNDQRKIEVFIAGCTVCEPVVDIVKSMACDNCDIVIYDISKPCDSRECLNKVKLYNITSLPAIVIDGKLLDCFTRREVTKEELNREGIGKLVPE